MPDTIATSAEVTAATSTAIGTIIAKFLPAAIGAGIMIVVDPPKTKHDLFARAFCAFAMSYLFGDVFFDFLQSFDIFSFLSSTKQGHKTAVDGVVGATGWFVAGGVAVLLKMFRERPTGIIERIGYTIKRKEKDSQI